MPESVFVKMAAETAATRLMGEVGRLAETETRFYRELAPQLTGRADVVRIRVRPAHRPLRPRARGPRRRQLRVPRHAAPARPRTRRARSSNCWRGCTRRSGSRVPDWVYSISADTAALVTGPLLKTSARRTRREDRHPRRARPLHRRQLPRGRRRHRPDAATPSCTATPTPETSTSATARRACWTGRPSGAATPAGSWPTR